MKEENTRNVIIKNKDNIISMIMDSFGKFNEFEKLGYKYVCWIIEQDLKGIEEENYSEKQCLKEFADIMIVIIRKLYEEGYDYKNVIRDRIEKRMKGNEEEIVNKYTSKYNQERKITLPKNPPIGIVSTVMEKRFG